MRLMLHRLDHHSTRTVLIATQIGLFGQAGTVGLTRSKSSPSILRADTCT